MIFRRKKEVKKPSLQEIKEHHQFFIENISKHMEIAAQWLNKERLDFSFSEIDQIGKLYRKKYRKSRKKGEWYDEKYEVFVTYCGETFIRYFLGEWVLNLEEDTKGYGEQLVMKYGPPDYHWVSICPYNWLKLIEDGDKEPLSLPYSKSILYFKNSPEWEFDPIKNLEKHMDDE